MKIYIDSREHQLISLFSETDIKIEQKQLDIGDILITDDNDQVYCIIERKTIKDMLASVKDGRYKEQKLRLVSSFNRKNILYLIEDFYSFEGLNNRSIESTIIHSLFRDELKYIFSRNIKDTFYVIQCIIARIQAHPDYFMNTESCAVGESGNGNSGGYFSLNSIKKSNSDCPESINKSIYCQIPGVSSHSAGALYNHYGSFAEMILMLKDLSQEDKMKNLQSIKVNNRKMNKNIISNIMKYVFYSSGS